MSASQRDTRRCPMRVKLWRTAVGLAALLKINGEHFYICRLLIKIQQLQRFLGNSRKKKWMLISELWGGIPKSLPASDLFSPCLLFIYSSRTQASLLYTYFFKTQPAVCICCLHLDELPDERSSHTRIKYGISSVYTSPGSGICHECNARSPSSFLPGPGSPSQRLPFSAGRPGKADHGPADGSRGDRAPLLFAGAPGCSRPPKASQDSGARGGGGRRPKSSPGSQGALGTLPQERHRDGDHKVRKVNRFFLCVLFNQNIFMVWHTEALLTPDGGICYITPSVVDWFTSACWS